jgi:hypothetical protein
MNNTLHTPGPWAHTKSREHSNPDTARRDIVAESQFGPAFIAGDVSQFDAALISAAPDLLSALERLANDYAALMNSQGAAIDIGQPGSEFTAGQWVGARLGSPVHEAWKAIAKAKGEA